MPKDSYYMGIAQAVSLASKDRSRQIGAVVVGPKGEIRSTGYNGFPRGARDDVEERHERPMKYLWAEHAERNAVFQAARSGVSIDGCSIFVYTNDLSICADCARSIIQSGIKSVVLPRSVLNHDALPQWEESVKQAYIMMYESGIEIRYWDGT